MSAPNGISNNTALNRISSNVGTNDQYVSYNTIDPYELELQQQQQQQQSHYSQGGGDGNGVHRQQIQQQQQQPAQWFDTDL